MVLFWRDSMFYNFELMVQKYKVRFSLWGNHQNFKQANNESTEKKSNSFIKFLHLNWVGDFWWLPQNFHHHDLGLQYSLVALYLAWYFFHFFRLFLGFFGFIRLWQLPRGGHRGIHRRHRRGVRRHQHRGNQHKHQHRQHGRRQGRHRRHHSGGHRGKQQWLQGQQQG